MMRTIKTRNGKTAEKVPPQISGARGGKATTRAKVKAARANILLAVEGKRRMHKVRMIETEIAENRREWFRTNHMDYRDRLDDRLWVMIRSREKLMKQN